jgi:hypothetical protein
MTLIMNAMGELDSGGFYMAAAFGENIAKGGTNLGAFLTCETSFAPSVSHQPNQVSKGHQQTRSSY